MTFKWDGKSRPSDDSYRKEFNRIFSKKDIREIEKIVDKHEEEKQKTLHEELMEGFEKEQRDLNESYKQSLRNKKEHTNEEN